MADGLDAAQFNWKPDPASWSVAECLVHLNVVAEAFLRRLETAVAGSDRRGEGPFEYGFLARKLLGAVEVDGPALKTSAALDPSSGSAHSAFDKAGTLAAFDGYAARYVAVCERADGLDLARVKVRHPFAWPLRLPLGAFLDLAGLHALRHVHQATRVTERPGFPGTH